MGTRGKVQLKGRLGTVKMSYDRIKEIPSDERGCTDAYDSDDSAVAVESGHRGVNWKAMREALDSGDSYTAHDWQTHPRGKTLRNDAHICAGVNQRREDDCGDRVRPAHAHREHGSGGRVLTPVGVAGY